MALGGGGTLTHVGNMGMIGEIGYHFHAKLALTYVRKMFDLHSCWVRFWLSYTFCDKNSPTMTICYFLNDFELYSLQFSLISCFK